MTSFFQNQLIKSTATSLSFPCPSCECTTSCDISSGLLLGECPKCKFTFCTSCRKSYHGFLDCSAEEDANNDVICGSNDLKKDGWLIDYSSDTTASSSKTEIQQMEALPSCSNIANPAMDNNSIYHLGMVKEMCNLFMLLFQ